MVILLPLLPSFYLSLVRFTLVTVERSALKNDGKTIDQIVVYFNGEHTYLASGQNILRPASTNSLSGTNQPKINMELQD